MADNVQWIKIKVGMFDGNSFKKIKRAKIDGVPYRDKLTAVWFELLDLAGKSNANGYLIDNNEIPYHTFEDIAIMLDREEQEIQLCMQFFINEKMVEIIDDIYCLTNFMKYQNEDGLEKIREQKRISQAKWREKKKMKFLGINVDGKISTVESTVESTTISTSASTPRLPSNSNSNSLSKSNSLSIKENDNTISSNTIGTETPNPEIGNYPTIEEIGKNPTEDEEDYIEPHGHNYNVELKRSEYTKLISIYGKERIENAIDLLDKDITLEKRKVNDGECFKCLVDNYL